MEDIQMKEAPEKHPEFDPETYTNPILEECYRIKAEISAQFKTQIEWLWCLGKEKRLDECQNRYSSRDNNTPDFPSFVGIHLTLTDVGGNPINFSFYPS